MSSIRQEQIQQALDEIIEHAVVKSGLNVEMLRGLLEARPYNAKIKLGWRPDYTVTLFNAARALQGNPAVLAVQLATGMRKVEAIERAEATGPYVNYRLRSESLVRITNQALKEAGSKTVGAAKEVFIIDCPRIAAFSSISQSLIESLTSGQLLANLLQAGGYETHIRLHISDWDYRSAQYVALHMRVKPEDEWRIDDTVHLPARAIRNTIQRLREYDSVEYRVFNSEIQRWLSELDHALASVSMSGSILRDSEQVDAVITLLRSAAHSHSRLIKADEDTGILYLEDDEIIPLIDHTDTPTEFGYELADVLSAHYKGVRKLVRFGGRSRLIRALDIHMAVELKLQGEFIVSAPLYKPSAELREVLLDLVLLSKDMLAQAEIEDKTTFTDLQSSLAVLLIRYESVIWDAIVSLNVQSLQVYAHQLVERYEACIEECQNVPSRIKIPIVLHEYVNTIADKMSYLI